MKTITINCQIQVDVEDNYEEHNLYPLVDSINDVLYNAGSPLQAQVLPDSATLERVNPVEDDWTQDYSEERDHESYNAD